MKKFFVFLRGSFKSLEMIFVMYVDEFDYFDIIIEVFENKMYNMYLCMKGLIYF